jgi:TP901 family phage tail tape measure protein
MPDTTSLIQEVLVQVKGLADIKKLNSSIDSLAASNVRLNRTMTQMSAGQKKTTTTSQRLGRVQKLNAMTIKQARVEVTRMKTEMAKWRKEGTGTVKQMRQHSTDIKRLSSAIGDTGESAKKSSWLLNKLKSAIVGAAVVFATFRLAQWAKESVQSFAEFEKAALQVKTLMLDLPPPQLAANFDKITRGVRMSAIRFGTDMVETMNAVYKGISGRLGVDNALKNLELAQKATIALGGNLESTMRIQVALAGSYHHNMQQLTEDFDVLAGLIKFGVPTLQEWGTSLSQVLPIAAQAGISWAELAASLALISQTGMPASQVVTTIKNAILKTAAPAKGAEQAIKDMIGEDTLTNATSFMGIMKAISTEMEGIPTGLQRIRVLREMFPNVRSMVAAAKMTGDFKDLNTLIIEMQGSTGELQKRTGVMMDSTSRGLSALKQWWQDVNMEVGKNLSKVVELTGAYDALDRKLARPIAQAILPAVQQAYPNARMTSEQLREWYSETFRVAEAIAVAFGGDSQQKVSYVTRLMTDYSISVEEAIGIMQGFVKIPNMIDRVTEAYASLAEKAAELEPIKRINHYENAIRSLTKAVDEQIPSIGNLIVLWEQIMLGKRKPLAKPVGTFDLGPSAELAGLPNMPLELAAITQRTRREMIPPKREPIGPLRQVTPANYKNMATFIEETTETTIKSIHKVNDEELDAGKKVRQQNIDNYANKLSLAKQRMQEERDIAERSREIERQWDKEDLQYRIDNLNTYIDKATDAYEKLGDRREAIEDRIATVQREKLRQLSQLPRPFGEVAAGRESPSVQLVALMRSLGLRPMPTERAVLRRGKVVGGSVGFGGLVGREIAPKKRGFGIVGKIMDKIAPRQRKLQRFVPFGQMSEEQYYNMLLQAGASSEQLSMAMPLFRQFVEKQTGKPPIVSGGEAVRFRQVSRPDAMGPPAPGTPASIRMIEQSQIKLRARQDAILKERVTLKEKILEAENTEVVIKQRLADDVLPNLETAFKGVIDELKRMDLTNPTTPREIQPPANPLPALGP